MIKGMDFIDLPSIFIDKSVQSSIPNYFKNCEVPIIFYKNNKPIRGIKYAEISRFSCIQFVYIRFFLHYMLYLMSINLFLILISEVVPLTPELARTLIMFIRLQVMLLRTI